MKESKQPAIIEKEIRHISGGGGIAWFVLAVAALIAGAIKIPLLLLFWPAFFILFIFCLGGFVIIRPNEAAVFTFFGRYVGTLRREGFYYVNPLTATARPDNGGSLTIVKSAPNTAEISLPHKPRLSLKTMTLQNNKQKINDELGNPIEVGIVVIWRIVDTAKAVFAVDNYMHFLSIQSDSALRRIVSTYPYDAPSDDGAEKSLRGSSQAVSDSIKKEIQEKVEVAGIEIIDAKITHLAYAPEIALAMLQRQQAAAVIDARKLIVEGAVGMVEMAIKKLEENKNIELSAERKAQMISNLLVVLCGNKDAQPVISNGGA